ncbi:hypothetical protein EOD42_21690 [Rhodovarius crocodyli]|uniref:Plastocyanin-like domain-containing protein n=1 Tax=Rhodovarius crocodyli TaxID=1979269 RepID=A0A437M245_9PROT|nr:multicopper oxidase domain-containing protein [Rhodovarius crocodyli]RVT91584.1 hypothetical protein EOD42_21690 [Rhodovarius crocodyli]
MASRIFVLLLALIAVPAAGAELREPRILAASPQPDSACGPGPAIGLLLRESLRPDVGPYAVALSGYGQGADPAADRYAPFMLRLAGGQRARIALRNGLVDEPANLHTHGLFTAPRAEAPCNLGDYSLFNAEAQGRLDYRIALPAQLPGASFGRAERHVAYPRGLAWFHAHVHGLSRDQVANGMAGLIAVGDPLAAVPRALRDGTDVRHLVLRDIQLTVPDCPAAGRTQAGLACEPGRPLLPGTLPDGAAVPARFGVAGAEDASWNPSLCGDFDSPGEAPEDSVLGPGFCARAQQATGRHAVWLFTVNGQWMPDITMAPGRRMLLRISNFSPSVTYNIEIGAEGGPPLPLTLLEMDGGLAGTASEQPGPARRVMLMPGARAEILLAAPGRPLPPGPLRLRTTGMVAAATGAEADVWPAMALATLRVPRQAPPPAPPVPGWPSARREAPAVAATPRPAWLPESCSILPPGEGWRRRITFDIRRGEEGEAFLMGQEVVDREGRPYPWDPAQPAIGRGWLPEPWLAHGRHAGDQPLPGHRICPVRGRGEVWEVVNLSAEFHNLHIHQGSFRPARAADPGAPAGLGDAIQDPDGQFTRHLGQLLDMAGSWHDSVAVAARAPGGETPRSFIYLPFAAAQQEGLYPIHCHILEHEDKGMMALVQVLPPAPEAGARLTDSQLLAMLASGTDALPAMCLPLAR